MSESLPEVLGGLFDAWSDDLHTAMPGRVETYDAATQKASVQPLIRRAFVNEEGERVTERHPVIPDVPVVFPGSGAFSITWPIATGDIVLLVFAEGSLDKWLVRGDEVDPQDERRHTLSDAIAIPGLRPFSSPVSGTHGTAMVIGAPLIHAGGDSALALNADLEALRTALAALTTGPTAPIGTAASSGVTGLGRTIPFAGTAVLKGS